MSGSFRHFTLAFLLLFIVLGLILPGESIQAQEMDPAVLIISIPRIPVSLLAG